MIAPQLSDFQADVAYTGGIRGEFERLLPDCGGRLFVVESVPKDASEEFAAAEGSWI